MTQKDRNRHRQKERETFINVLELGVQVRVKSMKDTPGTSYLKILSERQTINKYMSPVGNSGKNDTKQR